MACSISFRIAQIGQTENEIYVNTISCYNYKEKEKVIIRISSFFSQTVKKYDGVISSAIYLLSHKMDTIIMEHRTLKEKKMAENISFISFRLITLLIKAAIPRIQ